MSTTRVQLIDKNTTVGTAAAEDTKIVFDGNAQDFHIGIDDSTAVSYTHLTLPTTPYV